MNSHSKTPVTVLTGFLGAGKTTLVNHILTANHGHRIAVIENEFGDVPIDDALVVGNTEEKIIEMSNGCCLCCTARTDLLDILRTLLDRQDQLDRVLIETSGMADPNPVAQTFFVDDQISAHYMLDAIITMVDAKHIGGHLDEQEHDGVGDHVVDQIAFADRVVLNKIDLVSASEITTVERRLRNLNATAEFIHSSFAEVNLDEILGIGAFDLSRTLASAPDWLDEPAQTHDPTLESVGIEFEGDLDRAEFESWLANLVADRGDDLYRLKGILAVDDDHRRLVLQGIHRMYELQPGMPWGRDPRQSKIVFIGRDLDRNTMTQGLNSCRAARSTVSTEI